VVLRTNGKQNLRLVAADGSQTRPLADTINVDGSAAWSPDGKSIVTGGDDGKGAGLFRIPVDGGAPIQLVKGTMINPAWSPKGDLIVYLGPNVAGQSPLLAMRPDGTSVDLPPIQISFQSLTVRFLPNGKGVIYSFISGVSLDFWMLDLDTRKIRQIARLNNPATFRNFDTDGKQIVFDRVRENSDIQLIDLKR